MDINNILIVKKEIIELEKEIDELKTEFDEITKIIDDEYIKNFRKKNVILCMIFPLYNDINIMKKSKNDDVVIPTIIKYFFSFLTLIFSVLFQSITVFNLALLIFYSLSFIAFFISSVTLVNKYIPNLKKKKNIHTKLIGLNKNIQKKEMIYNKLINDININNFKPSFYDQMNPSFIYFLSDLQEIYKENPQIINPNNNNNSQNLKNY